MARETKLSIVIQAKDEASRILKAVGEKLKVMGAAAAAAAATTGILAVKEAAKFEEALGNIDTLLGDDNEALGKFRKGLLELQQIIPKTGDDLGASAYQIVSAGITDAGEALQVLKASGKLAVAGLGTTEQSTDLLTSALNAFQISAAEAERVSDILFKTVKGGKTTVAELSQSFGQVAPVAKAAGVSIEELQAATAALTTSGLQTSVAQTQLRAAINNLLKPGKELQEQLASVGITNVQTAIQSDGLTEVLQKLRNSVGGNEVAFGNLFTSVEAAGAVLSLTGTQYETFKGIMEDMLDPTNALNEAFEKQVNTFNAQWQLLKNKLNVILITLGNEILPSVTEAVSKLSDFVVALTDKFIAMGGITGVIKKVQEKVQAFLRFVDENTGIITILKQAFENVSIVFKELLLPELKKLWEALKPLMPFLIELAKVFGVILLGALIAVIKILEGSLIVLVWAITKAVEFANKQIERFALWWDTVTSAIAKVITKIDQVTSKIKNLNVLSSIGNAVSGFLGFNNQPKLAHGGIVTRPTSAIIGEGGEPEAVVPLSRARQFGFAGAGGITINIQNLFGTDGTAAERFANEIAMMIKRQIRV